jgi:hypothetical protein
MKNPKDIFFLETDNKANGKSLMRIIEKAVNAVNELLKKFHFCSNERLSSENAFGG